MPEPNVQLDHLKRVFLAVVVLALVVLCGATALLFRPYSDRPLATTTVVRAPMQWIGFLLLVIAILALLLFSTVLFARLLSEALGRAEASAETLKLSRIVETSADAIMSTDLDGRFTSWNSAAEYLFGWPADAALTRRITELITPRHRPLVETLYEQLAAGSLVDGFAPLEMSHTTPSGTDVYFLMTLSTLNDTQGRAVGVSAIARDISKAIRAEQALSESEARARSVLDTAAEGILTVDGAGNVLTLNRAAAEDFGCEPDDGAGKNIQHFIPLVDADTLHGLVPVEGERAVREVSGWRSGGTLFPMEISVSRVESREGTVFTVIARDLTDKKQLEQQLIHQALHDTLTALPNRSLLLDRLSLGLSRSSLNGGTVAVLVLGLDRFRIVNESLGHGAGDELLRLVGERLLGSVRPGDTAARIGGDEFAVLYELGLTRDVAPVADRITQALSGKFVVGGQDVFLTASMGVALGSGEETVPADLLRDAAAAMMSAKAKGRGRYEIYSAFMGRLAAPGLAAENDLRSAIGDSQLLVYYQPKIDLGSGNVVGAEALVRWLHPERGLIQPADFIPLAEETGLVLPLGEWVFAQACRDVQVWRDDEEMRDLVVSVNLSPNQLAQPDLVERFQRILQDTGADPSRVEIEITETALMQDAQFATRVLEELRGLGLRLAADDFGTGYSSLAYLRRFPLDLLKVDRSFVDGIGRDAEDTAIAAAVVHLAHVLGLQAVAEGVETREQLSKLHEFGCDQAQGFYWSRPVPSHEFVEYVRGGSVHQATAS